MAFLVTYAARGSSNTGQQLFPLLLPFAATFATSTGLSILSTKLHRPKPTTAAFLQKFGSCLQVGHHGIMHFGNILKEIFKFLLKIVYHEGILIFGSHHDVQVFLI
jgi:hypothetical protein